jgi:hypothetical protein
MKARVWMYAENSGDGSVNVRFFASKKDAETYATKDEEDYGDRFCDDISYQDLEFDESGTLLNPSKRD